VSRKIFIPKLNLKNADNHVQEIFRMHGFWGEHSSSLDKNINKYQMNQENFPIAEETTVH
jgi:hypothetical protein